MLNFDLQVRFSKKFYFLIKILCFISFSSAISAHHVLGRPAYSLNEDSNTPPSMQVEPQIRAYYLTYMVLPAFRKPRDHARINNSASRIANTNTIASKISF
mgnify:CR=1 FL=1